MIQSSGKFEDLVLQELGFKRHFLHRVWFWPIIIGFVAAFVLGLVGLRSPDQTVSNKSDNSGNELSFKREDYFTMAGAVATLGLTIVGCIQWSEARHEASIDKSYDRINLTNDQFCSCKKVCDMFPYFWDETGKNPRECIMYVYLELDNLEYAIAKYYHSSMETETAFRSLRTFLSRCQSEKFLNFAKKYVHLSIGYSEMTKIVVDKIYDPSTISNLEVSLWIDEYLKPPSP